MAHTVLLTEHALADLADIYDYISKHDSPQKAEYVLDRIEKRFASLSQMPERGAFPKELLSLGIHDYCEVFFKPYRIIYRIEGKKVFVYLTVDGRRDMQALLERRLLGTL